MSSPLKPVKDQLARYLSPRIRTTAESADHLRKRGYGEEEIREAIEDFTALGYLDDRDYVRAYCDYSYGKLRGRRRIVRELENRGIDRETIDNAVEDYIFENEIDEDNLARRAAEKSLEGEMNPPGEKQLAKTARKLEQMGYGAATITRILEELRT